MQLQHIELDKLKLSAVNMRHGKQAPNVSDILPSVKARGVLVPLLVRPNGEGVDFEIVAGLIPFMLEAFINADVGFRKARKEFGVSGVGPKP